jgi:hypothetical protein
MLMFYVRLGQFDKFFGYFASAFVAHKFSLLQRKGKDRTDHSGLLQPEKVAAPCLRLTCRFFLGALLDVKSGSRSKEESYCGTANDLLAVSSCAWNRSLRQMKHQARCSCSNLARMT